MWQSEGWGVYNDTNCPDRRAFSEYMYRGYQTSADYYDDIFEQLQKRKQELDQRKVKPTLENTAEIFPGWVELLKNMKG